jgi:phospholipid/cholesterol/gamma-HCH transport system substrate-binding protein
VTDSLPPPPPSRGHDRELIVGIFVIVGALAVLLTLFTFTDAAFFRGRYVITTLVPDAGGIRKGDPVQMRGVNIGRVKSFSIPAVSSEAVAIRLEIEGEFKIPSDSRIELKSAGLLGGVAADVIPGNATTFLGRGDVIRGIRPAGAFDAAPEIANRAQKTLESLQDMLSKQTVEDVKASSAQLLTLLKELSGMATEQRKQLQTLSASLNKSAQGIEKATAGPELQDAVRRLDALSQKLDDLTISLNRSAHSMEAVLGRVERGEGTLGRFSKDDSLYLNANEAVVNLTHTIEEMKKLTEDIRKQPKKYFKLSIF